jgi:serine/threonine-protein kinase
MAVVWRAYDPSLDREVAIKEPRLPDGSSAAAQAEFSARFVREARAAARLNHPGIVAVHSAAVYDERAVIVMELVEGRTLREVLAVSALTTRQAYALLDQLLAAVGHAHERGVIHRDLKPDNVFVARDGTVKLADFGIAQLTQGGPALTRVGTLVGTPAYMAPEQIRGDTVDARCDVFALGVIAYECLAGENPFGSETSTHYATIIHRIMNEPTPPLTASDALAGPLASVITKALAKERERRYESAAAMLAAWRAAFSAPIDTKAELAELGGGGPARAAAAPSLPEKTLAWGTPTGTSVATPPQTADHRTPSGSAPPPRPKRRPLTASGVALDPSSPAQCPACHIELTQGERFCRNCGRLIKRASHQ